MNLNRIAHVAAAIALAGSLSACAPDDTDPDAPTDDVATTEAPADEETDAPLDEELPSDSPSDEEETPADGTDTDAPTDEETPDAEATE